MKKIILILLVALSLGSFAQETIDCNESNKKAIINCIKIDIVPNAELTDDKVYVQVSLNYVFNDEFIYIKSDMISLADATKLQEYCITQTKKENIKLDIKGEVKDF